MSDKEHVELAEVLRNVKGKVALSSYDCALMDKLYYGWNKIEAPSKLAHSVKKPRREILWTNYEPEISIRRPSLTNKNKLNRVSANLFDTA
jgi:DNA adenine methylase